jgi:hypothetical protein
MNVRQSSRLQTALLAMAAVLSLLLSIASSWGGATHSGTGMPVVGEAVETERYRVTLTKAVQVEEPSTKHRPWNYNFRIEDLKSHESRLADYPDNYGTYGNQLRWFGLGGDWLYGFRPISIGIFSLATGKPVDDLAVVDPVVSPRGDAIAYGVRQLSYAGSDRQGSIVAVLDLATAKRRYVFPEPKTISEFRDKNSIVVMGPESDTDEQHDVEELFWAPEGDRLAFVCAHGFSLHPAGRMYLVVVSLGGPSGSHFIHQPLAPGLYRKVGTADVAFEASSITWIDAKTIEVRTKPEFLDKVRERFVVKLAEVPK